MAEKEIIAYALGKKAGGGGSGEATLIDKTISTNGTYYAQNDNADGYKKVVVDTPEAELGTKSVTSNGTYQATSDGYDGYSEVSVNVSANVGTKSITENGTYSASVDSLDGFSEVTVNVESDPWEKFDEFLSVEFKDNDFYGGLKYIKRDYMAGIPKIFTSGNKQLLYANTEFFSVKAVDSLYGYLEYGTFRAATSLKYIKLPELTSIMNSSLTVCSALKSLIITKSDAIASLQSTNAFSQSGIANGTGYIYVPDSLKTSYQEATNWSTYATQIKGYSEATAYDGTTTYEIGDVCKYNDKFYGYCKSDLATSTGNAPTGTTDDNAYWEYVADIEV